MSTTTQHRPKTRELAVHEEPVRCTVCGLGASGGTFLLKGRHHVTTISADGGAVRNPVEDDTDHEPVCDNIGPDGRVYGFGRIVATQNIGPYSLTTVEMPQVEGEARTVYVGYIAGNAILDRGWHVDDTVPVSTNTSHDTLDEALAFLVAYRHQGLNAAAVLGPHFYRGLKH